MATLIPIPKLGQSEETVKIEKWRAKEGDKINKGDILFEVETDKAVLEVESQFEGVLLKIVIQEGIEVPVMSTAAVIGTPGEAIPEIPIPKVEKKPEAVQAPAPRPAQEIKSAAKPSALQPPGAASANFAIPAPVPQIRKPRPSPRARNFAKDYLVNLDKIPASGACGARITESDVKNYLEKTGYFNRKITPAAFNIAKKEKLELLEMEGSGDAGRVTIADVRAAASEKPREFSQMRKVIAKRLTESKQKIPHFYVTASIDMTNMLANRKKLKEAGIELGVNTFIVKAVAMTLREFPMLNAESDGLVAKYKSKINIGVAVSVENGLVVPVVKNADKKELDEIQAEIAELADKARKGKLSPDEMKGGTFTISNMGMLNVENFAAIINPGESGILAVSSTVPTPVVREGQIVIRDMMKVTVSADHRVVDGADAAKFANALRNRIEKADFATV